MEKVKEVREYKFPNATVTVRIPDLAPEEYKKRHKILERAAEDILKEIQDIERAKKTAKL